MSMNGSFSVDPNVTIQSLAGLEGLQAPQTNPNFKVTEHSQQEIQAAKKILQEGRRQKAQKLKQWTNNKSNNPFLGSDVSTLLNLFLSQKEQDQKEKAELKATMKALEDQIRPRTFTSSQLGLSFAQKQAADKVANQAENDVIMSKTKILPTGDNLQAILDHLHIPPGSINHRQLKDLFLLDDFHAMASYAIPLILEHGPSAIKFLWDRLSKKMTKMMQPSDPNSTLADMSGKLSPFTPAYVSSSLPNADYSSDRTLQNAFNSMPTSFDTVSYDGIATVLCPEKYRYRLYVQHPLNTAIAAATEVFTVTTDASGNLFIMINPSNVTSAAVSGAAPATNTFFFSTLTGWVPDTGVYTNYANFNAPLLNNAASFKSFKIAGFSIKFIPLTSSINNQGVIRMGYIEDYSSFSLASGSTDLQLSTLAMNPYFQEGNFTKAYRAIYLPDNNDTLSGTLNTNLFTDGFIIAITNAPVNTAIGTFEVNYVYELNPTQANYNIMTMQYATPGPATLQALSTAILTNPGLQMLPLSMAYPLAKKLFSCGPGLKYQKAVAEMVGQQYDHKSGNEFAVLPAIPEKKEEDESFIYE